MVSTNLHRQQEQELLSTHSAESRKTELEEERQDFHQIHSSGLQEIKQNQQVDNILIKS